MKDTFEKQNFAKRLKSMLKVDFKRMFTMPLVYILTGVCFIMPILILVMTSLMGTDGETSATFTNVWQSIGSVSGSSSGMDLTSMCNINMLYFLVAVLVCIFVADDFRSGYAKNLFTVRAKKTDYIVSKTLVTFVGSVIMFAAYFIGALVGGAIAGLPFTASGFGTGGIVACMISKIFVIAIFVSISLILSVFAKQKLWLSIIGSFAAGMLLYTMIPIITPLNSNFLNIIMCFAGGGIFAVGLGAISSLILNKTNIV